MDVLAYYNADPAILGALSFTGLVDETYLAPFSEEKLGRLAKQDPTFFRNLLLAGDLSPAKLSIGAEILGRTERNATIAVPALLTLLNSPSSVVREGAVCGLSHHVSADIVVKILRDIGTGDPSPGVRAAASDVIATLDP